MKSYNKPKEDTRICLAWNSEKEEIMYVEYDKQNNEIVRRQICELEEVGKILEIFMNHYNLDALELGELLITKSPIIE